jgi:ribosome-associated protein
MPDHRREDPCMPVGRPVDVPIRDESIRLGQSLKLADLDESGADAKELISEGKILVNGEPKARRRRQLRAGDVVESGGRVPGPPCHSGPRRPVRLVLTEPLRVRDDRDSGAQDVHQPASHHDLDRPPA